MPYNLQGEWSIWDTHEDISLDMFDDGFKELPPAPPSPAFDGHLSPNSIFTNTNAGHTESHTTWIPARKELRLYVMVGVMGQLVSAMDLKTELGRARSEHGRVDFISLVFRQGDYKARSTESANLRGWLSRNGFRKIDSYNGHGILVKKDLTIHPQVPPTVAPRPEPRPLTAQEEAQRYRDAGLNIPPTVQQLLALEKAKQDAIQNDPSRRLEEIKARIAELQALQDGQKEKVEDCRR